MTTQSITSVTDGQKKQVKRFAEDAVDRAIAEGLLDKDGLQRVIENGDDLQAAIVAKIRELSVTNEYADEERESSYAYPKGYKVKGITEQTNILRQLLIGFADEKLTEQPLPANAEGWFAIPRWEKIAPTYNEAVEKVLELVKTQRQGKFYNRCEGQLGPQYLRQTAKTARVFQKLGDEQKDHDILVVPAQFGLRHRGRSVRRAREVFMANEFGLGAFVVGIMILTHPERLKHDDDLWIDCAGDEYSPDADGRFERAPSFKLFGGLVSFGTAWFDRARWYYGAASGFVS